MLNLVHVVKEHRLLCRLREAQVPLHPRQVSVHPRPDTLRRGPPVPQQKLPQTMPRPQPSAHARP
jgi:hypothetical protein